MECSRPVSDGENAATATDGADVEAERPDHTDACTEYWNGAYDGPAAGSQ